MRNGGGGRIRTHGEGYPTTVFKTAALSRSATPPWNAHTQSNGCYSEGSKTRQEQSDLASVSALQDRPPSHVILQHLRDTNAAIRLLIIFQNRDHCSTNGKTRPIQGVE